MLHRCSFAVLLVLALASDAAAQARRSDPLLGYRTMRDPGAVCRAAGGSWTARVRGGVCSVTPAPIGGVSSRTEVEMCFTGDICRVEMFVDGRDVGRAFPPILAELTRRHGPGRSSASHTVAEALERCAQSTDTRVLFVSQYSEDPLTIALSVRCRSAEPELRLRYRVAVESGSGPSVSRRPPITPLH